MDSVAQSIEFADLSERRSSVRECCADAISQRIEGCSQVMAFLQSEFDPLFQRGEVMNGHRLGGAIIMDAVGHSMNPGRSGNAGIGGGAQNRGFPPCSLSHSKAPPRFLNFGSAMSRARAISRTRCF